MSDNRAIFTNIYKSNRWGSDESASGRGSELRQTGEVREAIGRVIIDYGIKSVVDAPCGDFNWMPHVLSQFPAITYSGFDIVEALIEQLQRQYADQPNWNFAVADITKDPLPAVDLIVCRDCLVHLTTNDARRALGNILITGARYLLATTYPNETTNRDTNDGHWRPINLQEPPYSLPEYIDIYDTDFRDGGRNHPGNHLALWDLDSLRQAQLGNIPE